MEGDAPQESRGCPMGAVGGPNAQGRLGGKATYYGDYLQLDKLLDCQTPFSKDVGPNGEAAHDEMLFIIVHQTYELWFKQILHELRACSDIMCRDPIEDRLMTRVHHHLNRVVTIFRTLIQQLDILETMTPLDFMDFRDFLYPASGFQSFQFRVLENVLGLPLKRRVPFDKGTYHARLSEEHQRLVRDSERGPSLFDAVEQWLERTPYLQTGDYSFLDAYRQRVAAMYAEDKAILRTNFAAVVHEAEGKAALEAELGETDRNLEHFLALFDEAKHARLRAKGVKRLSFKATQAALLINLYQNEPQLHLPYLVLTRLVDIDEALSVWRHRHLLMVHRMIGSKLGTGGSSGFGYLNAVLQRSRVFADLGNMSTYLIKRAHIPQLPKHVLQMVNFPSSVKANDDADVDQSADAASGKC